jgi:hypothetical protein
MPHDKFRVFCILIIHPLHYHTLNGSISPLHGSQGKPCTILQSFHKFISSVMTLATNAWPLSDYKMTGAPCMRNKHLFLIPECPLIDMTFSNSIKEVHITAVSGQWAGINTILPMTFFLFTKWWGKVITAILCFVCHRGFVHCFSLLSWTTPSVCSQVTMAQWAVVL